jgi:hypothetical protein
MSNSSESPELSNLTNMEIEEFENGILKTTYSVRNSVLNDNPDNEIQVTAVYENSQPDFKMRGITAEDFINEYLTLADAVPEMRMTNKIYIITLSPEDKKYFEDPTLILPKCVGFYSDVTLEHTPDTMPEPPLRNYTIKNASNKITCQITVNAKYDAKMKKFVNDDEKIKEEISKCLYSDYMPQIPYIRIVNSKKISDNEFDIYFAKVIQKNDTIKPLDNNAGKNKSRKVNKGYKSYKSHKSHKAHKAKKSRKGRKNNGRRKTIKNK